MTHYAKVESGVVRHVLRVPPETIFRPEAAGEYTPAPEGVQEGWLWDGVEFSPPPNAGPTLQEQVLQTIQQMEREQLMARITRESLLRLAEKEADELAQELGVDPALLLAKNKGYTALKAFDNQIAALRELL